MVCATIIIFHTVRKWNHKNITRYKEVYLCVPIEILVKRDQKQLNSYALKGDFKNVMAVVGKVLESSL